MNRFAGCLLVVGVVAALSVVGCASPRSTVMLNYPHATQGTLAQSPHEHFQTVSNVAAHDGRALIDDLDLFFMTDRPTRLTKWHVR